MKISLGPVLYHVELGLPSISPFASAHYMHSDFIHQPLSSCHSLLSPSSSQDFLKPPLSKSDFLDCYLIRIMCAFSHGRRVLDYFTV